MTQIAALIGDPVAHSISPLFQQAAFDALGIDARYQAWLTPASMLAERLDSLRAGGMLGANVTVPHKQAVMPLLDQIDPEARQTGAVNTIVSGSGRLTGHNTDIVGFVESLRVDGGLEPAGLFAVVLGAGGAARAVVHALLGAGAARVLVLNRTERRAIELAEGTRSSVVSAAALATDPDAAAALVRGCDLLINCTTIGMRHGATEHDMPLPQAAIPSGSFVADIVANPLVTPLLAAAAARQCRTLGGLPMLVRQGAASFRLWTGLQPPIAVMFEAASRAMQQPR